MAYPGIRTVGVPFGGNAGLFQSFGDPTNRNIGGYDVLYDFPQGELPQWAWEAQRRGVDPIGSYVSPRTQTVQTITDVAISPIGLIAIGALALFLLVRRR